MTCTPAWVRTRQARQPPRFFAPSPALLTLLAVSARWPHRWRRAMPFTLTVVAAPPPRCHPPSAPPDTGICRCAAVPWRCRHSAQVGGGRRGGLGGLAFSRGGRGGRRRSGAGDYGAARGLGAVKALSGLSCPAGGPARPRGQREHGFSFLLFLSKSLSCVASLFAFTLAHSTVRVWPASARGIGRLLSGKYPRNPWKSSLLSVPALASPRRPTWCPGRGACIQTPRCRCVCVA